MNQNTRDGLDIPSIFEGIEAIVTDKVLGPYVILSSGLAVKDPSIEPWQAFAESAITRVEIYPQLYLISLHTGSGEVIEMEMPDPFSSPPINGRSIIYLDQKDWSAIARSEEDDASVEISLFKDLLANQRLISPLSFAHVTETAQWSATERRYRLATTLGKFTRGWQMMHPMRVWRRELTNVLSERMGKIQGDKEFDVISLDLGCGFLDEIPLSEVRPKATKDELTGFMSSVPSYLTSYFDLMLANEHTKANPVPAWAEERQRVTRIIAEDAPSKTAKSEWAKYSFIQDVLIHIVDASKIVGMDLQQVADWILSHFDEDIRKMPALGYWYEVFRQKHLNSTTVWVQNDLNDLIYLSCAAGYVDIVVAERSAASFIDRAAKTLGRIIRVYTSIDELVREDDQIGRLLNVDSHVSSE